MDKEFIEKVVAIQRDLKAPKGQYNSFGKYHYRSAEDILNSVKPLLADKGLVLTITDEVKQVGSRFYIESIATLTDGVNSIQNSALAREDDTAKGMSGAQITGATSSYARKYALNGLFAIDDTKDADATNDGTAQANNSAEEQALHEIANAKSREELNKVWNTYKNLQGNPKFSQAMADACKKYPKA